MEITDVTTIDQLTDAEVDELLERALNPRTPIEIFYAVLDRIGGPWAAAPDDALAYEELPAHDEAPASAEEVDPEQVPAEVGGEV